MPRDEPPWRDRWPTLMGLMLGGDLRQPRALRRDADQAACAQQRSSISATSICSCSRSLLGLSATPYPWAATEIVRQVSPVVIPILAFGALIPAPPKKALMVSFGAAAMDPLAYAMMRSPGHGLDVEEIVFLLASPFLAALIAQRISRGRASAERGHRQGARGRQLLAGRAARRRRHGRGLARESPHAGAPGGGEADPSRRC